MHLVGKGKRAGKKRKKEGAESNYKLCPQGVHIERTEVAGAVFGAEQLVAFQLKEMFTTKALLVKLKIKITKKKDEKKKPKRETQSLPATCRDLIRSLVEV